MKIVKSYEESGLLIKGVSETTENQAKQQEEGFLSMLLGTVGATLLGNLLIRGTIREQVNEQQDLVRIFNPTRSFNKF